MEAVNLGPSPRERERERRRKEREDEEERESARLWELWKESRELRGIKAAEEEGGKEEE